MKSPHFVDTTNNMRIDTNQIVIGRFQGKKCGGNKWIHRGESNRMAEAASNASNALSKQFAEAARMIWHFKPIALSQ